MTSGFRELPRHGLAGLLLLTLLSGLLLSTFLHAPLVVDHVQGAAAAVLVLCAIVFGFSFWVATRPRPLPIAPFLTCYLAAIVVLYGVYLGLVRPELQTDFLDMWLYAQEFASSDVLPTPERYEAQRALPVLTPLVLLFGASPWVYKVANVVLLLLASLIFYDLTRRWFGHSVGQAFLVLFPLAPEPYFAAATTSHDISGLFFSSCAFWLAAWLYRLEPERRWAWLVLCSAGLGATLALLQVQRGVSSFFLLAVMALLLAGLWSSGFAQIRQAVSRAGLMLVIPYVVMTLAISILSARGLLLSPGFHEEFLAKSFANFSGSFSPGTFDSQRKFREMFLEPLEHEEIVDLGRQLFLSDFYYDAPRHRPGNYLDRAKRLFSLASQEQHYYAVTAPDSPPSFEDVGPALGVLKDTAVLCFSLVGAFALAVVVFVVRPPWVSMLPLVYLGGLIAGLLLVGENQPRYLFPIWLILPATIGLAFARLPGLQARDVVAPRLAVRVIAGPLLLFLLLAAGWGVVRAVYDVTDGRIIGEWDAVGSSMRLPEPELQADFDRAQLGAESGAAGRAFGSLVTTLRFPQPPDAGDWVEVSRQVCALDPSRRTLGFHLYWGAVSKAFDGAFDFAARVNAKTAYQTRIGSGRSRSLQRVRIAGGFQGETCVTLSFRVTAHRASAGLGWQTASTAHIYFPRLVR